MEVNYENNIPDTVMKGAADDSSSSVHSEAKSKEEPQEEKSEIDYGKRIEIEYLEFISQTFFEGLNEDSFPFETVDDSFIQRFKTKHFEKIRNLFRWRILANNCERLYLMYYKNLPKLLLVSNDERGYSKKLEFARAQFLQSKDELNFLKNSLGSLLNTKFAAEYCREYLKSRNSINQFEEIFQRILAQARTRLYSAQVIKQKIESRFSALSQKFKSDQLPIKEEIDILGKKISEAANEAYKLNYEKDWKLQEKKNQEKSLEDLQTKKISLLNEINEIDNLIKTKSEERQNSEKQVRSLSEQIKLKKNEVTKRDDYEKKCANENAFREQALKFQDERGQKYLNDIRSKKVYEIKEKVIEKPRPENLVIREAEGYLTPCKLSEKKLMIEISTLKAENDKLNYELTSIRRQNSSLEYTACEYAEKIPEVQIYLTIGCGVLLAILIRLYIFNT